MLLCPLFVRVDSELKVTNGLGQLVINSFQDESVQHMGETVVRVSVNNLASNKQYRRYSGAYNNRSSSLTFSKIFLASSYRPIIR